MKLADFVKSEKRYDSSAISADAELNQELQSLLIDLGLLTTAETEFGDRSKAALTRFQLENGCDEPDFLGPITAAALLEASAIGTRAAAASVITLTATQNTILKKRPLDSQSLPDNEKYSFPLGTTLDLTFFAPERKHYKVVLTQDLEGSSTWYAFCDHVKIEGAEQLPKPDQPADQKPPVTGQPRPNQVKLNIPYKSQRDNFNNPDGSCNVTSIAMCLEFLSVRRHQSTGQFEDELYEYALDHSLSRHDPYDLAKIVQDYGAQDHFDKHATMDRVKDWLAAGKPIVTHGYFTTFGHIVVLTGYDDQGFIVHDPYGEWFASGYDRNQPGLSNQKGKFLHYSYRLIETTCASDDEFWVHFISK